MPKPPLHRPAAPAAPAQATRRSAGQQRGTKAASVTSKGQARLGIAAVLAANLGQEGGKFGAVLKESSDLFATEKVFHPDPQVLLPNTVWLMGF